MIEAKRGIIYRHRINGMIYRHVNDDWFYKSRSDGEWYPSMSINSRLLKNLDLIKGESIRILTAHDFDFPLTLDKSEEGMFVVTYGVQVTAWQKWADAFNDFTECVAHAANEKGLQHIH